MLKFDVRNFSEDRREELALRIQASSDFNLPKLKYWNYDLCPRHRRGWIETSWNVETKQEEKKVVTDRPFPGCRKCGIHPYKHQNVGIMWLYMRKRGLLADPMGPQPLSSPILTPTGWTTMGEVAVGDAVVDPEGSPSRVVEVVPQGKRAVYRVTFSDGSSTEAADSHPWLVNSPDRKHAGYAPRLFSTEQILAAGIDYSNGNHKWYIPMTGPVEFTSAGEQVLDPYLVGVLLGDGSLTGGSVGLSTDHEIVNSLHFPEGVSVTAQGRDTVDYHDDFRVSGLMPYIRALRIDDRGESKKIPEAYLWADVDSRVAVLQGLLDTDGSPMKSRGANASGVEYGTVSKQLAEDVRFLVESLGGTASITEKSPSYEYDGEIREGQLYYRMYLRLPNWLTPFRLQRKLDRWTPRTKYEPTRAIVSIEYLRDEEVQCIRVSAPSHLYLTNRCIVTHNTGKTTHAGGLIALLAETGEIRDVGRVIIVPRAPALGQWNQELLRMIPALNVAVASGPKKRRIEEYTKPWNALLISPQTLINDEQLLSQFPLSLLITDDVDALRNPETKTAQTLKRIGMQADRMVVMTGTPLQKRLRELWSTLEPLGGAEVFGPLRTFEAQHTRPVTIRERDERTGLVTKVSTVTGYRNLDVVKQKMAPMVLRRRIEDLNDINMPEVNPSDVFLDLYPAQRSKYEELRQGVLSILKEEGTQIKHVTAMSKITYGAQICGGLATLGEPDGPMTSVKMDWIMEKLTEELEEEKVVIFSQYKNSIHALHNRLRNLDIGYETIWGEVPDKAARQASQERFWNDKDCRVIIGTQAIEQSLNLQVARHLINMDMILNPARMSQLAGRIRRSGSIYRHVFVHNLLTVNTQEERYLPLLEREAALASHIWDESSELFNELSPQDLMRLITG